MPTTNRWLASLNKTLRNKKYKNKSLQNILKIAKDKYYSVIGKKKTKSRNKKKNNKTVSNKKNKKNKKKINSQK
mgnify:FL=1